MNADPISNENPRTTDAVDPFEALQQAMAADVAQFAKNPQLNMNLGEACLRGLASHPKRVAIIDHSAERRAMPAGLVLALAWSLSRRWRHKLKDERVGVVLPPGIGATVVNLALVFMDRVPVNLNFTIGTRAAASCIKQAGLTTVITAGKLRDKYPQFPWPDDTRDVVDEIKSCSKAAIAWRMLMVRILPLSMLVRAVGISREGGDKELGLLFTSGSSGDPKGVALTHRNIMANALQILETGILPSGCSVMACLPVFHSFGFTVTMWYPMVADICIVSYPSPLDTRKLAEVIEAENVDVLVGSATFLRPFLRRARPEQLAGLKFAVAGAERLPDDLFSAFKERFGVDIMQGYGLTETSPVLSVNRPADATSGVSEISRLGTVGVLMPGIEAKIVSVDDQKDISLGSSGILCVRGPNIFSGYLDNPQQTTQVLRDGWFVTGDVGRFDADGFLSLEGRLSRFSKIGGEMVPHVLVEEHILQVCGWDAEAEQVAVVVGIPDHIKGESLVLLTSRSVELVELRGKLLEVGLPNLWVPRAIRRIEMIPMLATGKCDLRACMTLAQELA